MTPTRSIQSLSTQLVTFHTSLRLPEAAQRLEARVGFPNDKDLGGLRTARSADDVRDLVNKILDGKEFFVFQKLDHTKWVKLLPGTETAPGALLYTIGNPLVAQTIFTKDIMAASVVPFRILLVERADRKTDIVYYLPASLLPEAPAAAAARELLSNLNAAIEGLVYSIVHDVVITVKL
ncbi:hypothetical protein CC1G_00256 [Coprinopsis cinerea okayama7|uniref:DUF302 domain-containing protein n=1 Tax=Coprinopsis cinerea (strain Okayama-7 / 130 / ATCC MYA-4618 / FGSC 9003) TaxID=240176 RepID=A8NXB5_COPC7|nr:hypothetical protein CC1G_00256 [Coprinopsis cinerea okayama7\|eukprot:XP_001837120.1 hypothetical protein CC1G_00256 [Coprinopsis cinerea okayama7\